MALIQRAEEAAEAANQPWPCHDKYAMLEHRKHYARGYVAAVRAERAASPARPEGGAAVAAEELADDIQAYLVMGGIYLSFEQASILARCLLADEELSISKA